MSISAKEIAARLGISPSAVSLALNDRAGVSEKTRKMVIDTAKELGYDMSKIRGTPILRGQIVLLIFQKHGAVVSDTLFFSDLTNAILRACRERRYTPLIHFVSKEDLIEQELRSILQSGADGLILLGTEMRPEDFAPFYDFPLPMVVLDTYFDEMIWDCVEINNDQGAYLAARFLLCQQRGQPGYLRSSYPIRNFDERADGFYKAIRDSGLSASQSIVHYLAPNPEGAYSDMKQLLADGVSIASCYFADNDLIATGAIKAFKEAGYRIPEDIAVIGFDNTSMCEMLDPPLTTINVPRQFMGRVAVEHLISILPAGDNNHLRLGIQVALVNRGTV